LAGTEAKDLANFIVEPVGTNINSPTTFTVRKKFQDLESTTSYTTSQVTTMFDDIMDQMSRPTGSSSNMKGGLLYLKNGTYLLNSGGIVVSDTTDDQDVSVRIIGETRDNTILKANTGMAETKIVETYCTLDVENVTFDGDSTATVQGLSPNSSSIATKILKVKNCKFTNINDFDIWMGHNQAAFEISECIFENHRSVNDQVACECINWGRIHDNVFDKTTGELNGENLTSGTLFNCDIYNNYINRTTHDDGGISLEPFDTNDNYANCHIHGNTLINAGIKFGGGNLGNTRTYRNIVIDSNSLYGGGIAALGPDIADHSTQVKEFSISNNTIMNPYKHGVVVTNTAGIGFVRNNTIYNANVGLDTIDFDKGGIYAVNSIDLVCESNSIYMGVTSPADAHFSPYGIKYENSVNFTLRDNRILNRTLGNESYVSLGSHTGTKLISHSL
jgi:hypothetical protein